MVLVFSQEDLENFVYNASQKMYKLDFFCNILTATVLQKLSDSFLNELFEYMVINENASVVRTILESERSSKISCLNEKKIVQKFYTSEGLNKILDLFKIRLKKRTRAI